MSEIGPDRLQPTAPVSDGLGQEPRREPGPRARRMPTPATPQNSEPDPPEVPPHQVETAWLEPGGNVNLEPSSAYELLEQRLTLWRFLVVSLEHARKAVLQSDLENLRCQTARQQEICEGLRGLEQLKPPSGHPIAPGERRKILEEELQQVEVQVAHLNLAYGALLRRARRTVGIFCRVLASTGLTYTPPRPSTRATCEIRS